MALGYVSSAEGSAWSTSGTPGAYTSVLSGTWGASGGDTAFIFIQVFTSTSSIAPDSLTIQNVSTDIVTRIGEFSIGVNPDLYTVHVYCATRGTGELSIFSTSSITGLGQTIQGVYSGVIDDNSGAGATGSETKRGDPASSSLTTLYPGSWMASFVYSNGGSIAAGAGTTERIKIGTRGLYDSNAVVSQGSNSLEIDPGDADHDIGFVKLEIRSADSSTGTDPQNIITFI